MSICAAKPSGWLGALLSFTLTAAVCALPATAEDGWSSVQKLTGTFVAWNGKPDSNFYRKAAQLIDYNTMSERALGQKRWTKLGATQRKDFTSALERLLEQRYYIRWHKIFSKGKLTCTGQTASGQDTLVKTNLTVASKVDPIVWRLVKSENKVISLSVGDKDLLQRLSSRLDKKITSAGFERTLAWMQKKSTAEDDATAADSTAAVTGESN